MIDMSEVVKINPTSKRNDLCLPPSEAPEGMSEELHEFMVMAHGVIGSHADHDTWHDPSGDQWPDTDWFWFDRGGDAFRAGESGEITENAVFQTYTLYITEGQVDLATLINDSESMLVVTGECPDSFRLGYEMAQMFAGLPTPTP